MEISMTTYPIRAPRAAATILLALLFTSTALACQQPSAARAVAPLSATEKSAAARLDAATIRQTVEALSSKEMEGRGTATPGGERAAQWIADRFKALGLEPAGVDGSYFQAVPFRSKQIDAGTRFSIGSTTLDFGNDYVLFAPLLSQSADLTADVVLAGFGVVAPDLGRDDFANVDVKGKIAVVLSGRPAAVDAEKWKPVGGQQYVVRNLVTRGAAAVVFAGFESSGTSFEQLADYFGRRSVQLASAPEPPIKTPPAAILSDAGAAKLFAAMGEDYAKLREHAVAGEALSRDLGHQATLSIHLTKETGSGSNVAAVLHGSDPALKNEAIVYTAHYDAFGLAPGGGFYPGAADNALGVGEIVAIAEAMTKSKAKPRRSVIFLAVTGEEHGLLGAEYWAGNPTWPLDRVVADINYDGIGTEVYGPVKEIVGFGAEYSTIGEDLAAIAPAFGTTIVGDPMPEEKAFYRSDHYALVKRGVPALMLLGAPAGTKEWVARAERWLQTDYHQQTDVIGKDWDWEGPKTVALIGLVVGLRVANAETAPQWLEGSPFQRQAPKAAAKTAATD
jgi:hypothetical protein